jgi:hypothetical protein
LYFGVAGPGSIADAVAYRINSGFALKSADAAHRPVVKTISALYTVALRLCNTWLSSSGGAIIGFNFHTAIYAFPWRDAERSPAPLSHQTSSSKENFGYQ